MIGERLVARLQLSCLTFALLGMSACVPEECSLDVTLMGALDWQWVWRHPTTSCEVSGGSTSLSFDEVSTINFLNDSGDSLYLEMPQNSLVLGTHFASVIYTEAYINVWASTTDCIVNIIEFEVVDWVREDRYRMRGTVECPNALVGDGQLTLSNVAFSIYAPDVNSYLYF